MIVACVPLYMYLAVHVDNHVLRIAILPAIFFTVCMQAAQFVGWRVEKTDGMSTYDDPTAIVVVGAVVVFYEMHSLTMALICFALSGVVIGNIRTRKFAALIFNVFQNVFCFMASLATLYLLDFQLDESVISFVAKITAAALVYTLLNNLILNAMLSIYGGRWNFMHDSVAKLLAKSFPLVVFSGLLGRFYFDFGPMMLWTFFLPMFLYYFLHKSLMELQEARTTAVDTLIRALEAKDPYTASHAHRVAKFANYIGEEFGFSERRLERLHYAALLHDIGKLIIPNSILNKPGPLSHREYQIILRHEAVTEAVLNRIEFLSGVAHFAGANHNSIENINSSRIEPHIIAVCDAFDAMTSSRSYRRALSQEVAFDELHNMEGQQFLPHVVDALINVLEKKHERYGAGYEVNAIHENAPRAGVGSAGLRDFATELVREELDSSHALRYVDDNFTDAAIYEP